MGREQGGAVSRASAKNTRSADTFGVCETASDLLEQTVDPLTALLGTLAMLRESSTQDRAGLQRCLTLTRRIQHAIEAHGRNRGESATIRRLDPRTAPPVHEAGSVREVAENQVVESVDA